MSVSLMTARESYGPRSDHEFLTCHQVSVSRPVPKRTLRKWQMAESKTEKKKTMWVKKVVVSVRRWLTGAPNDSFLLNTLTTLLGYLNY